MKEAYIYRLGYDKFRIVWPRGTKAHVNTEELSIHLLAIALHNKDVRIIFKEEGQ